MRRCETGQYKNISKNTIEVLLTVMRSKGAIVKGNNPWTAELPLHDVKLTGAWDADKRMLDITIHKVAWFIPCHLVWSNIDSAIITINNEEILRESN